MPVLTDEIKEFIVKGLARYDLPYRVIEGVQANFGVTIDRFQVRAYDPSNLRPPAQRWRDLHAATREAHLREVAATGISQKAVRIAMLDSMARELLTNNAYERAAAMLEQAAKECGGIYENRKAIVVEVPVAQTSVPEASVLQTTAPLPSLPPNRPAMIEAVPRRQLPDRGR